MGKRTTTKGGAKNNDKVRKIKADSPETKEPASQPQRHEATVIDDVVIPMHDNPVKYDLIELRSFVDKVFHKDRSEDEMIFTQLSGKAPRGFGAPHTKVLRDALEKTEAPMRGYFSTSTITPSADGSLRHTKTAFKRFCVLVLDDIGTKIEEADIPDAMAETYAIETSAGNFQLGYVLDEPLESYEEAQMLIDYMVDAGLTDGGGAMPCKKVRLPCGVNGKEGDKEHFKVTLQHMDGEYWSPQDLLDAAGLNVNWTEARKTAANRQRKTKRIKTTAWNPDVFYYNPQNGVYDPVLEFLATEGMVVQEFQEPFMDIICPWHDEHTDVKDIHGVIAGYSPIGHGLIPTRRVFHCFHEHCKGRKSQEFLAQIRAMGGPHMPVEEFAPEAVMNYVYDKAADRVYDLSTEGPLIPYKIEAINRITPAVFIGPKSVQQLPLWLKQPSSVSVDASYFDASTRDRLMLDDYGNLVVNRFYAPEYPIINPDMEMVRPFLEYLEYLIPNAQEREYFTGWLACKVKNPAFRGAAIVMIAKQEGTGRNTFIKMLNRLFGVHNIESMVMDTLLHAGNFNDWRAKLFIHVDESLATEDIRTARRAYNRLKELVDPMAREVMINAKHEGRYLAKTATSFLFFSNHDDALYLQEGSRRFFAIQNPDKPAHINYFVNVWQWLASDWMVHVWNYMLGLEVDEADYFTTPPMTLTMETIRHETTSAMEAIINTAIDIWPSSLIVPKIISEVVTQYIGRGVPENHAGATKQLLNDRLKSLRATRETFNYRVNINSQRVDTKIRMKNVGDITCMVRMEANREVLVKYLEKFNVHEFKELLDKELEARGFDF